MNILWINHRDPRHPQAGGAEARILEIGKRLLERGIRITLLCEKFDSAPSIEKIEGMEVKRLGGKYCIHVLAPLFVKEHGEEFDIVIDDIAHAVPWFSNKFTKKPVIAQIHHVHQDVVPIELNVLKSKMVALLEKRIKSYNSFITVSSSTKEELETFFRIPGSRINVVYNGVDHDVYRPSNKKYSDPTIVYIGRLKKYKRIDHVIRAFKIIVEEKPNAKLIIVGGGEQQQPLKNLAQDLNLFEKIEFKGHVSDAEKIDILQKSWASVATSVKEGFGISVLEAAACGVPGVVYDVPGLRESVKDCETGLLVTSGNMSLLADRILTLIDDETLRERLGKNALVYSKNFS